MMSKEEIIKVGQLAVIRRGDDLELHDGDKIYIKPAYFE